MLASLGVTELNFIQKNYTVLGCQFLHYTYDKQEFQRKKLFPQGHNLSELCLPHPVYKSAKQKVKAY